MFNQSVIELLLNRQEHKERQVKDIDCFNSHASAPSPLCIFALNLFEYQDTRASCQMLRTARRLSLTITRLDFLEEATQDFEYLLNTLWVT